jgi:predicted MFS family arabinose efflux permease
MLIVWLGIAVFFFSTGVEISVGQWSFIGRILFGFITERIGATRLLRLGMAGMILGTLLLWWNPANLVGFSGLALIGFSVAPIYPLMIGLSPARFGGQNAANAIGFQVAAAYLGGALLPALVGVAAYALGLEVIGLLVLVFSVLAFAFHEVLVRKCGL